VILTIGALRRAIEGVADDIELVVRVEQEEDEHNWEASFCGGVVSSAGLELAHDANDTPFFVLDCGNEQYHDDEPS
jgi:hypothetical protein